MQSTNRQLWRECGARVIRGSNPPCSQVVPVRRVLFSTTFSSNPLRGSSFAWAARLVGVAVWWVFGGLVVVGVARALAGVLHACYRFPLTPITRGVENWNLSWQL